MQQYLIDINNYEIIKPIGVGGFGQVYLVQEKKQKKEYAAKIIKINCEDPEDQIQFIKEIKIISNVNYPTILHFCGYNLKGFNNNPNPTVITDFIPNGSLHNMLEEEMRGCAPMEWSCTYKYIILFGIALGLNYLHSKNIVHRDIKPTNILLKEDYYPIICDFGLSQNPYKTLMKTYAGTPLYMAPEIINRKSYNFKVDVYSFSIIAYQTIVGNPKQFEFDLSQINGRQNQLFLEKCHSETPSERPTFYEICCFMTQKEFLDVFNEEIEIIQVELFFDYVNQNEDDGDSLFIFGLFLYENNEKDSIQFFEKAALKGNVDAIFHYAKALEEGSFETEVDKKNALFYYKQAADKGHAGSMFRIAQILENESLETEQMEANFYLYKAANLGHEEAKLMLNKKILNYNKKNKSKEVVQKKSNEKTSAPKENHNRAELGGPNLNQPPPKSKDSPDNQTKTESGRRQTNNAGIKRNSALSPRSSNNSGSNAGIKRNSALSPRRKDNLDHKGKPMLISDIDKTSGDQNSKAKVNPATKQANDADGKIKQSPAIKINANNKASQPQATKQANTNANNKMPQNPAVKQVNTNINNKAPQNPTSKQTNINTNANNKVPQSPATKQANTNVHDKVPQSPASKQTNANNKIPQNPSNEQAKANNKDPRSPSGKQVNTNNKASQPQANKQANTNANNKMPQNPSSKQTNTNNKVSQTPVTKQTNINNKVSKSPDVRQVNTKVSNKVPQSPASKQTNANNKVPQNPSNEQAKANNKDPQSPAVKQVNTNNKASTPSATKQAKTNENNKIPQNPAVKQENTNINNKIPQNPTFKQTNINANNTIPQRPESKQANTNVNNKVPQNPATKQANINANNKVPQNPATKQANINANNNIPQRPESKQANTNVNNKVPQNPATKQANINANNNIPQRLESKQTSTNNKDPQSIAVKHLDTNNKAFQVPASKQANKDGKSTNPEKPSANIPTNALTHNNSGNAARPKMTSANKSVINKDHLYQDENGISYILHENALTAEITSSPTAKGNVFIQSCVNHESKKYKITLIGDNAFANSMIESISFPKDSYISRIGNSPFENSKITKFRIPAKLEKFKLTIFQDANNLEIVEVDPNNSNVSAKENAVIFKKKVIIFVQRSFSGDFYIQSGISLIGNFAFSNMKNIQSIISNFPTLKIISPYSFNKCENLKIVSIKTKKLEVKNFGFFELRNLISVELDCEELIINDNCFKNCTKLSKVLFNNVVKASFSKEAFNGCINLSYFVITGATSIALKDDTFCGANNLKYIELQSKSFTFSSPFMHCSSLRFLFLQTEQDILLTPTTFRYCHFLSSVKIVSMSKITVSSKAFEEREFLENVDLRCDSIDIQKEAFNNCSSLVWFCLKAEKSVFIHENTFSQCPSLKTFFLFCSSSLAIREKFEKTSLEIVILCGPCIIIEDNCFCQCSKLSLLSLVDARNIVIGKNQFLNCTSLQSIKIEFKNESESESESVIEFGSNCLDDAVNLEEITLSGILVRVIKNRENQISSYIFPLADKENIISYFK